MLENRIRALREEKGMTQVRLSIELEVAQETVSAYETNKHCPSVAMLLRMRELFDTSIDYILGLSPERYPLRGRSLEEQEAALLSLYRRLTPVQQERAQAYLLGMADSKDK